MPDLKLSLDEMVRRILFAKELGRCYVCGDEASDVAHLITRGRMATRFDTHEAGNCHLLCRKCHDHDHRCPSTSTYRETFIKKNGEEPYLALRRRARAGERRLGWMKSEVERLNATLHRPTEAQLKEVR